MKIYKYLACFALAAVAVFAVLAGSLNQDEGWYLYAARLVGEGKTLYGDFFFTQGPVMPLFYSKFNWIWENFGILGARVFTLTLGVLSIFFAAETAKKFVDEPHKAKVFWMVVLLLGSNLYHIYYLAIPKTYALASLALMVGFYFYFSAVEKKSAFYSFLAGAAFAVAASTRISLASAGVVAVFHIFSIRKFKRSVSFCFVLGAVMHGFFAYMPFLADAKAFDDYGVIILEDLRKEHGRYARCQLQKKNFFVQLIVKYRRSFRLFLLHVSYDPALVDRCQKRVVYAGKRCIAERLGLLGSRSRDDFSVKNDLYTHGLIVGSIKDAVSQVGLGISDLESYRFLCTCEHYRLARSLDEIR